MKFSNLKISHRLTLSFGIILLMLVLSIGAAMSQLSSLHTIVDSLVNDRNPKLNTANMWVTQLLTSSMHTRNILLLTDREHIRKEIDAINEEKKLRTECMEKLQKTINLPEGKAILQEILEARSRYMPYEDEFLKLVAAGDMVAAKDVLLNKAGPEQAQYIQKIEKMIKFQNNIVTQYGINAENSYLFGREVLIALGIGATLLSIIIALLITKGLLKQLGGEPAEAANVALMIAEGDLTAHVHVSASDQTSMMYAIKKMRDNLAHIVTDVRSGTDTIALASSEISAGNLDLSSRTEQQAASLEETASSMEELTTTVKQNADNSRQANKLATTASEVAVKGGTVVAQVVNTMGAINESAKKIVDIIGVIDGIAFQTNILALNAAVEAARAGEQGRGFAVVATEVRNLAQRSAAAAKEIKGLINDSVEKVDTGSKLVNQAGTTMQEVVASVKQVSDIINEITEASGEQASGIDQINAAISQMDEVTQQNASLVEEAAAAAGSLQEQAQHLVSIVRVFKTEETSRVQITAAKPVTTTPRKTNQVVKIGSAVRTPTRSIATKKPAPKAVATGTGNEGWEEF